ncbi:MAG: sporulation protein YqfD [Clostridia bacterium]|nr:sporulation protein YqfD [Clostridia bacterium]
MLLTSALRWFPGWVRVELEGGYPVRMLNEMTAAGLPLWNVRLQGEGLRLSCPAVIYRHLRPLARRACMRMRVQRKHGLPFWLHRYRRRGGLVVGLAVYGILLALLAPRIWAVEVVGNTATPTQEILTVAQDMGVLTGRRMDSLDIKRLEIVGLSRLPTIGWITVNPRGSVARVEVTERGPTPQVLDLSTPSDIVALRDGLVTSVTVRSGTRAVKEGEAVKAGDLLIGGRVESELGEQLYRAYGEVWAQTQRRITVTVPLAYEQAVPDGLAAFRPTVTFLCWELPLYCVADAEKGCIVRERRHFLQGGGLTLPLGVVHEYRYRTRVEKKARTAHQAAALAAAQLAAQEKELFLPDSFTEIARQEGVQKGQYVLSVTYQCIENIAVEVPLGTAPAPPASGDAK